MNEFDIEKSCEIGRIDDDEDLIAAKTMLMD